MNIKNIHDCFGCGVCAIACGRRIIDIRINASGFYEPRITEPEKCTNCGLCVEVCSFRHDNISLKNPSLSSYAAWSKEQAVLQKCSSGGVGFEIGRELVGKGYKVCAVKFNAEKNQAEHYIAKSVEELIPSIGSKYIQSYTVEGFRKINRKEKYLVTGTPCQIDSFRRYIQRFHCEDNFVLLDFFCHGVPSKLLWNKYVKWAEKHVGRLTSASWRNKQSGVHTSFGLPTGENGQSQPVNWHDSYNMHLRGENGTINSSLSKGDKFYRLFFSDSCLGKACYKNCRFKWEKSSADIRIGDAWGKTFSENEAGVSVAIAFSEKGNNILQNCNCELRKLPLDVVAEGQMRSNVSINRRSSLLLFLLHIPNLSIEHIYKLYFSYRKIWKKLNRK